ncbi:BPSL1445 family SYLF domain-containing lipoprotein [Aerosticca soli]|uniref:Putative lipoprotein n=1 Tax=Aerosticca soli TaxID=2010829 RepID=A0A2Z6E4S3_9GAMM|nr:YSC84-related protein [Aerosticca soli]MDI3262428.1 YSC84-related protein [Fulvimonas sp.]BBD80106.1 putative lipoprotein [Aerosticca soli]
MNKRRLNLKLPTVCIAAALVLGGLTMSGCTTTPPNSDASGQSARAALDHEVDATLARLYKVVPGSKELIQRSAGVLVFPSVVGGSFIVGAEYGKGALREGGRTTGYYSTTAGSLGFQAGGQSKAVIYVFNTREALNEFKASSGWTVGANARVAVAKMGADGSISTETAKQPVAAFVLTNVGLEAGAAIGGAKISRITL